MLQIWGRQSSSNVQALMWCVGELGLEFKRYDIGHKYGGTDTDDFFKLNPNRTVPVLQDRSNPPIWETGAILRYLSNSYAPATFWPGDPIHRAGIDKWAEWSKINIALGFTAPIFWRVVRTAPADRDQKAIRAGIQNFEAKLEIAEQQLSRFPFLAGENFTLADIQFGHVLYRYFDINIDRCDLPSLEKYYKALCQRAAYKEHVMLSYDELRVEY